MRNHWLTTGTLIFDYTDEQASYIKQACSFYGLSIDKIFSKRQTRQIVYTRQYAMYLMRKNINRTKMEEGELIDIPISFQSIADIFSKDHATVIHACNQVQNRMECKQMEI